MTLRLYELTEAYRRLQDLDDEDFDTALGDLADAIEVKAEGIARVIRSLEAEGEVLAAEAKRLLDKSNTRANRADGLKAYLLAELTAVGLKQVKGPLFTVAVQDSTPRCSVVDMDAIPEAFRVYPPSTWRPDARAIIQLWRDGQAVPGTEVVVAKHLRIR